MATKTISLRQDAYERLRRARQSPDESFTQVILRAQWPGLGVTARELREVYRREGPFLDQEALDRIDEAKRLDSPLADQRNEGSH